MPLQMVVHYFLNSDFRFTFPIKLKFNFIDFALHLLLEKEKNMSNIIDINVAFKYITHSAVS